MRHVAFLRAINVGGRNVVQMVRLREVASALGYGDVATYIQSGNLVFTSPRPAADVAEELGDALLAEFGHRPAVIMRDHGQLDYTRRDCPFRTDYDPAKVLVMFFAGAVPVEKRTAFDRWPGKEEVVMRAQEAYINYPDGMGTSRLTGAVIERELGVVGTGRNLRTVTRLAEMSAPN